MKNVLTHPKTTLLGEGCRGIPLVDNYTVYCTPTGDVGAYLYPANKKYYYDIRPIWHTCSAKILLEKCYFDIYLTFLSGAGRGGYVNVDFFPFKLQLLSVTLTSSKKVDTITQGVPKAKSSVLVILNCKSSSSWPKPLEFC